MGLIKDGSSVSQSVTLAAGPYSISFDAAQRGNWQSQPQQIEVLVNGAAVDTIKPSGTTYAGYTTPSFSVTAGTHTIELLGLSPSTADSTAFVDTVAIESSTIGNGSFETPALAAGTWQFSPAGTSWQFTGSAGISSNQSAFTAGNPNAPDGTQVGLIKDGSSVSQSVTLAAGPYSISFDAAQRGNWQSQPQQIEVLVNGAAVDTIKPSGTTYAGYTTPSFSVTAGTHTIELLGLSPSTADSTAFVDTVAIESSIIGNGSFETPSLAAGTWQFSPSGSSWQFTGNAGISGNRSAFTAGNPNAPDGTQVGLIKDAGSISQTVQLTAGGYQVSFQAAQRGNWQSQPQQIEVLVDGSLVGTITPSSTAYATYATPSISVTAGTHTIELLGLAPSTADSTVFIDLVSLAPANGFTIAQATPTIQVTDTGGTYNGLPFPATVTVASIDGTAAASLEGVTPIVTYCQGNSCSTTPPTQAGTYTAYATFPGSTDYAETTSAMVTFTIAQASPTIQVTDSNGTYNGLPFPATVTVTGVDGSAAASLEGVTPIVTYCQGNSCSTTPPTQVGTYTVEATFLGSTDYAPAKSATVTFTVAAGIVTVTQDTFQQQVIDSPVPVLVDFSATWCSWCQQEVPVLQQLAADRPDIKVAEIDYDTNPTLVQKYNVTAIPRLLVFQNGQKVADTLGYQTEAQLLTLLNSLS